MALAGAALALLAAGFAAGAWQTRRGAPVRAASERTPEEAARRARAAGTELERALDAERTRAGELARRVRELEDELAVAGSERLERELQWLDFTRAVATFDPDGEVGAFARELLSDEPGRVEEPPPAPDPEEVARAERADELRRSLRALLRAEWVYGLDLLEVGRLDDAGFLGPVVFRLLDDRGRLSGSLVAERLRLEASRNGHVVTLVLEEGSELHGGEEVPFRDGVRRILLPGVDPGPFLDALPELFSDEERAPRDDGLWDTGEVERTLSALLAQDATGDVYRVRHVGGVDGDTLYDVHVEVRPREGGARRHLFADRMRVALGERGVRVVLEDGATLRGDASAPFLDGRYRIFLPRADQAQWRAAGIPGLAPEEPESP